MELYERIKEIRKDNKLSQTAFGEKLSVTRDVINNIENNRVEPKQLFINYLCEIFNINKDWLLTGKGEMYIISEQDEKLTDALAKISLSGNDKLKKIVENLIKLDEKTIDTINDLIDLLIEKEKN